LVVRCRPGLDQVSGSRAAAEWVGHQIARPRTGHSFFPILPDPAPARLLLDALKSGRVVAIRGGEPVPAEWWFGRDIEHLSGGLRLQRDEILKQWPAPAKPAPTAEELATWYREHCVRPGKRDDMVKACHDATGASWRLALAAIPPELRRKRGGAHRLSPRPTSAGSEYSSCPSR
jgi:hypothetical protein